MGDHPRHDPATVGRDPAWRHQEQRYHCLSDEATRVLPTRPILVRRRSRASWRRPALWLLLALVGWAALCWVMWGLL